MRTFILSNVPKGASQPYSFRPFWDKIASQCNLHSERIQDLLISPPSVASCFLFPAVIAVLVWSPEQAGRVMPCTRWLGKGEPAQHPHHSHSREAATVTCRQQPDICRHSHQHRSPLGTIHILEIPGMSGEHTPFSIPLGATTHSRGMQTSFLRASFSPLRLVNELSIIQFYWWWSTGHHFFKCCQRLRVQVASSAHEFHVVLPSSTQ